MTSSNLLEVKIKLTRRELCDVKFAVFLKYMDAKKNGKETSRWKELHDELKKQLEEFDKNISEKESV